MSDNYIAIGDIHGRYDLLDLLLKKIDEAGWPYANGHTEDAFKLVFLGDMVDRGPDSFKVVERVKLLCEQGQAIALLGNHEDMMMEYYRKKFFDRYDIWLANGGKATIKSYGNEMKCYGSGRFFQTLGESGHFNWLKELPYYYETDKVFFSHAPISARWFRSWLDDFREDRAALTWTFEKLPEGTWERKHGKLAVCGHIHALFENILEPRIFPHIIYADTGCGCSNRAPLTGIIIENGQYKSYIQAKPSEIKCA